MDGLPEDVNMKKMLHVFVSLVVVAIVVAVIDSMAIGGEQIIHAGHLAALVIGLVTMVLMIIGIVMLYCRVFSGYRVLVVSLCLGVVADIPTGIVVMSGFASFIHSIVLILNVLVIQRARGLALGR